MPVRPHEHELQAYVDGQLDGDEAIRIERYLTDNPAERARIDSYRDQKALLGAALRPDAEEGGPDEAPRLAQLESQLASRLKRRRSWLTLPRAAAAATLFFLGAGSHALLQEYQDWRLPPVVEAATKAHEVFGNDTERPVELRASARRQMASWFEQHLGAEVELPDLSGLGLHFVGGRLLTSVDGPMAQLLYQDRGANRLTVYLSGGRAGSEDDVQIVKVANYTAGYWQEGDFTYTIVADMESDDLREIAFEVAGLANFPRD